MVTLRTKTDTLSCCILNKSGIAWKEYEIYDVN